MDKSMNQDVTVSISELSIREAGSRGGRTTRDRYGSAHYKAIGRKGGKKTAELYGQLMRIFGEQGGRPRSPFLEDHPG